MFLSSLRKSNKASLFARKKSKNAATNSLRVFSSGTTPNVMSPIFYVNAKPHIGHLYTAVYCDAIHRFNKQSCGSSFFSIGTDEHGLKIQKRAELSHNGSPQALCDENSTHFAKLFRAANLSESRFVRTTEEGHKRSV